MLVPVATAALALAVALAGYVMVKFYGVVFLGLPREELAEAHDAGPLRARGLLWLAGWCVLLGIAAGVRDHRAGSDRTRMLVGATLEEGTQRFELAVPHRDRAGASELQSIAVPARHRSDRAGDFPAGAPVLPRARPRARRLGLRLSAADARMQDSAEGFGQPIKQIFEPFFKIERTQPEPFDARPFYSSKVEDRFWYWAVRAGDQGRRVLSALVGVLQHGRIHCVSDLQLRHAAGAAAGDPVT